MARWARFTASDGPGFGQIDGKSFCPFGPAVATDLDLSTLRVRTPVDGGERQNYGLDDTVFPVAQLVSRIRAT